MNGRNGRFVNITGELSASDLLGERYVENYEAECEYCHGKYVIPSAYFAFGRLMKVEQNLCPNPECRARFFEEQAGRIAEKNLEDERLAKAEAIKRAGIPADFIGKRVADMSPSEARNETISYIKNFETIFPHGKGLVFYGSPGTGKTHLACALLQALLPKYSGRYRTVSQILYEIRSTFSDSSRGAEADVIRGYIDTQILVIDEIGATSESDFEQSRLFNIIDGRIREKRPTIFISNLLPEGPGRTICSVLGERVYDRMFGSCVFLAFEGASHRRPLTSVAALLARVDAN